MSLGGGEVEKQSIYDPRGTSLLESALTGMVMGRALQQNPNLSVLLNNQGARSQLSSLGLPTDADSIKRLASNSIPVDYNGLLSNANALNVNQIQTPTYRQDPNFNFQAPNYSTYNFSNRDVSNIPQQAYNSARNQAFEDIAKQSNQQMQQGKRQLSRAGLARSGMVSGLQRDVNRTASDAMSTASRNIGTQQAQSTLQNAQFGATQEAQRQAAQAAENKFNPSLAQWQQQQQAAENLSRSNLNMTAANNNFNNQLQSQQQAYNLASNRLGLLGSLQQQRAQSSDDVFNLLKSLYTTNVGIPTQFSQGQGDFFSSLLGAGAQIGSAALMRPTSMLGVLCLPHNTQIELEDGTHKSISEINVGDVVKGGTVLVKYSKHRKADHRFTKHHFEDGKFVIMTDGHPYFDKLISKEVVEDESGLDLGITTNDILTSSGAYYINGVKIKSTLEI